MSEGVPNKRYPPEFKKLVIKPCGKKIELQQSSTEI